MLDLMQPAVALRRARAGGYDLKADISRRLGCNRPWGKLSGIRNKCQDLAGKASPRGGMNTSAEEAGPHGAGVRFPQQADGGVACRELVRGRRPRACLSVRVPAPSPFGRDARRGIFHHTGSLRRVYLKSVVKRDYCARVPPYRERDADLMVGGTAGGVER